ncbi:HNH endonuclease [Corynebacterium sp. p3-SID1145]|uniref:HNH endonuclease signature motif containing protein n=1 Tax=unclassified Corynebacterium TaxID=2624378 RepID=UPI0021AA7DB1|nr:MULTISPECIES: HNH endonuclease signature motif containing protein [unclassified Corynebacterium]MCT1451384.1 HNH endonuclease [Corynebacterium sp. p3-SID1145]MCT1460608.1 HNH endonuclease [Corynebacterium sp. p3-SID1140]
MNQFTAMLGSLKTPLDFLEHFDAQEALDAGLDGSTVKKWETIYAVYLAPTKWTRQQRYSAHAARAAAFTADQLWAIESRIKHITDEREKWRLRLKLLDVRGRCETLKRKAAEIVPERKKPTPKRTMGFGKSRDGMRPLTAMGTEEDMAALEFALRKRISPDGPAGPQMLETLMGMLGLRPDAETETTTPAAPAVPRPLVLIPLPDYLDIVSGDGDETILGLSDGTTITGADYLAKYHGADLQVATFHPQEGAVNLYRTSRFANKKQRDLARACLSACPVPDCRHSSDNCEVHHITSWSRGGQTNMANLAPLCRYHNRTNDDDPKHRNRGSIVNIRGRPVWRSPRGYPVDNKVHPFGAMSLLFGN